MLSHIDEHGRARMVDVSAKDDTVREAVAAGEITMQPSTLALIAGTATSGRGMASSGTEALKKGDVFATAKSLASWLRNAPPSSSLCATTSR